MASNASEFFDFAMEVNLNEIIRFHNYVRVELSNRAVELANDPLAKAALENYSKYLATNTFLMVYSYFEEYLHLLWKSSTNAVSIPDGGSINRYGPVLRELGISTEHPSWNFMMKATEVRHCLLHANGRLTFMKKGRRAAIDAALSASCGDLIMEHDRLRVNVAFVSRLVDEVRAFRKEVEQSKGRSEAQS